MAYKAVYASMWEGKQAELENTPNKDFDLLSNVLSTIFLSCLSWKWEYQNKIMSFSFQVMFMKC